MLNVLIADDNKGMRLVLSKALATIEGITIVKEVESGIEAINAFDNTDNIDVVFLDIDMPGINGIDTAKLILDIKPKCKIIFITGYENYMSQAFELYAYDYIVKPFKLERLHKTINRIKDTISIDHNIDESRKNEVREEILIKLKDGMALIKAEDIIFIERENRATSIITNTGKYITNKTLIEMENLLPSDDFIRSHKSYIIRIDKISTISVYGRWTYIVKFKECEQDALLTKEKAMVLEEKYGKI